jgi:hypothetical protein
MRKSARIRIAILALMLVASNVALLSHVTAHFEPGLGQCELCVSQAQLLTAISSANHTTPIELQVTVSRIDTPQCVTSIQFCFAYHQRAPPLPFT